MSSPDLSSPVMSSTVTVQLDEVQALAAELAVLAAELDDDAGSCRATAVSLSGAFGGDEAWTAGAAGHAWAALTALVAGRARAVAGTLAAAVDAYRAADLALARRISGTSDPAAPRPDAVAEPR